MYYMSENEYKLRKAILDSNVCQCGGILTQAKFRGENIKLCTSCQRVAMQIRRVLNANTGDVYTGVQYGLVTIQREHAS